MLDESDRVTGLATGLRSGNPDVMYLWQVGVAPELRGKGYSGQLIEAVISAADELGCRFLEFSIDPDNSASLGAFESVARRQGKKMEGVGSLAFEDGLRDHRSAENIYRLRLR